MDKLNNTCPICHRELLDGEQLLAYYYKPKNWFMLVHLVPKDGATFNGNVKRLSEPSGFQIPNMHEYCGKANWQLT